MKIIRRTRETRERKIRKRKRGGRREDQTKM
jgi:hypothetical protein